MKRTLARIAITAVALFGVSLVAAPAAQATPGNCTTGIGTNSVAYGVCTSGTGQFRIGIPCKNWFTAWHAYSSWKNVNVTASVGCPFGSGIWWNIPGGPQVLVEKRN